MKESMRPETVNTPPTMAQTLVRKWVKDLYSSLYCTYKGNICIDCFHAVT